MTVNLGVRHFFERVIGLDNHYAFGKIEKGKMWLEKMNNNPNDVLMIGDTIHDFEVAMELNIDCILIPSGHHSKEKLVLCGVPILSSISEVPDFVSNKKTSY